MAVSVMYLFLAVPWVGLWFVIMAFPSHTHLFFSWSDRQCERVVQGGPDERVTLINTLYTGNP